MATQGKVGSGRKSCNHIHKTNPIPQAKFLQISSQGGHRVRNDQIVKAMSAALVSPKAAPETVRFIISLRGCFNSSAL